MRMPGIGWPTLPILRPSGLFAVAIGLVSERPYPSNTITPRPSMNSATSFDSAAPPLNAYLSRPPNLPRIFANTTLSATARTTVSLSESALPSRFLPAAARPAWNRSRTSFGFSAICFCTPA